MNDTSLKAEQVQINLLRAAGVARRVELVRSVSSSVIDMSRRAIARCHPDWSEVEVKVEFVKLNYGEAIADRVRQRIGLNAYG
jgi:hypothetical protein